MIHRLALTLSAVALALCVFATARMAPGKAQTLQATENFRWYRGNMHTHSHWSDGDDYLEMIARWYQNQGYQFLVFTDHNVLPTSVRWVEVDKTAGGRGAYDKLKETYPDWIEERHEDGKHQVRLRTFSEVAERFNKPEEYLLIQGEEISDAFERRPIHLNVSNIKELIEPRHGSSVFETIQNNVDAAIAQRERTGQPMLVHLNHPNFHYGVTAEDFMRVQGEKFFEVYNGVQPVNNQGDGMHASTERIWDIVLSQRLGALDLPVMYGLACDDGHNYHKFGYKKHNPGRGWVMVLASALTPESLIESLEAGRFYASSGVELSRVESSPEGLSVEVAAVPGETYTIDFIGTRNTADLRGEPVRDADGKEIVATYRYSEDVGTVLKTVEGPQGTYEFQGDELYVRALVTSSAAHPNPADEGEHKRAWVQPLEGPGIPRREATGR